MSEPFLAEIRIFGFDFAPQGWALCDGQILPINQNQSLYSLLGTTYGGDGETSFALPDLRGRVPIHVGSSGESQHPLGQRGGEETHTLSVAEMPTHRHDLKATDTVGAQTDTPTNNLIATSSQTAYGAFAASTPMRAGSITNVGGSQAHENSQPSLALNFAIALQGLFPSQS